MSKVLEFMLGAAIVGFIMWLLFKFNPLLGALAVFVWLIWGISHPEVEKQEAVRKINRNLD